MTKTPLILFPLALVCSFALASCDEVDDLFGDPSFQAWCGDSLCAWVTESGRIDRVGTWHPNDYGVSFVDTPTVLSQDLARPGTTLQPGLFGFSFDDPFYQEASDQYDEDCRERGGSLSDRGDCVEEELCIGSGGQFMPDTGVCDFGEARCEGVYVPERGECLFPLDTTLVGCVRFEVNADVEDTAQVLLEIDYMADGSVDESQPIVGTRFAPVSFLLSLPNGFGPVRFRMRKQGEGRAVLAYFGARPASGCSDLLELEELPLSAACETDDQCSSNTCADVGSWQVCSECDEDADCDAGNSCQVVFEGSPPTRAYRACRAVP